MGGKKPLRRPLWPPTRATASNYYPLGLDGAGGAAKPLLRAPKKPAPLHGRLPAFSGAVDAFERARKCFLEWRYFFSIILSEFLKNRVALQQTRGHILIDGKKARAAARRRESYYCGNDTSTQFFTASVAEELLLNTELTEENKDRVRHLLKEFGLYEYRAAHPSALSGGQKQRLAIACAVFSGRRILILDEPTSGLDGQNMRLIAERLKSEARNGRTILVITHDRELIESCCDTVVEVGTKPSEVQ